MSQDDSVDALESRCTVACDIEDASCESQIDDDSEFFDALESITIASDIENVKDDDVINDTHESNFLIASDNEDDNYEDGIELEIEDTHHPNDDQEPDIINNSDEGGKTKGHLKKRYLSNKACELTDMILEHLEKSVRKKKGDLLIGAKMLEILDAAYFKARKSVEKKYEFEYDGIDPALAVVMLTNMKNFNHQGIIFFVLFFFFYL